MIAHRHEHQESTGRSLLKAAKVTLEGKGGQWTPMREAIFTALVEHEKPASAYDIAYDVSKARGKRIAPNSVYRILDLFVSSNLAMRVESANAYIVNAHPRCLHDCIFLVCNDCGGAIHVDDELASDTVRKAAAQEGFKAKRPVIEVLGTCAKCS